MPFCTYRKKKKDNVKSFYNTEIKNDATQYKMRKHTLHLLFKKKKGCAKSVIMQAGENRIYRKKDKPQTLKFHLNFKGNLT